jgi:hypothetical protein
MTEEPMPSLPHLWVEQPDGPYIIETILAHRTDADFDDAPLQQDRSYLRLRLVEAKVPDNLQSALLWTELGLQFDGRESLFSRVTPLAGGALTDPIPYTGGAVVVETSILDRSADPSARTAADVLLGCSRLIRSPLNQAIPIAREISAGAASLVMSGTAPVRAGFRLAFGDAVDDPALRPCYLALVVARPAQIDASRLSVADGRLHYAADEREPRPLEGYDYLLLQLEGMAEREDWQLPDIDGPFRRAIEYTSRSSAAEADAYRIMTLAAAWRSPDLSVPDRRRVVQAVNDELEGVARAGLGATGDQVRDLAATMQARAMGVEQAAALGPLRAQDVFGPGADDSLELTLGWESRATTDWEPAAPSAAPFPDRAVVEDAIPTYDAYDVADEDADLAGYDPDTYVGSFDYGGQSGDFGLLSPDDETVARADDGGGHEEEQPGRFFRAEFEDYEESLPLSVGGQYTVAFSVGLTAEGATAAAPFQDDVLRAADSHVEVFDLTVQLDSGDFEIFEQSVRPLRVPRTGRSLGKARFDISPRHDGPCTLTATVHDHGNFVQQMELTITVGDRSPLPVEISTRGRSPDSVATLEPRDISIILEPAPGGGFSCTAMGSVVGRTVLPITELELDAAVRAARAAMMTVIQSVHGGTKVFQQVINIPPAARDAALRTLARAGQRLFQQLFLHPAAGADARAIGNWLQSYALNPGLRLTVQVVADHAPLPWAMLYLGDASDDAQLDWNNFLGMRHIVEQLPLQTSLNTRTNEISSQPRLAVSLNVNTFIDQSMGIALVAQHQRTWAATAAARTGLTLVTRSTKSEVVQALASASTGDQVVYFYCHATAGAAGNRDPDQAAITMGKQDSATVADLNIDAPTTIQLAGNPLVFINACESADLSPLFYNGFVPYFMAKGARGVVGTECKTPVLFAIKWADDFFDQFLSGAAVGETVLKLRQDFLRKHNNPLGLIYAVHCDADTRIMPALGREEAAKPG